MEVDERIELVQKMQGELWEDRLNETRRSGRLCAWASSFHHEHLLCRLEDSNLRYGSYNAGCKLVFDDDTVWLLRFPRAGRIHDGYADEKVTMEVAVINLIRRDTTVPVPKIKAWGVAAQNPLGLGPFIIMEYIHDGVSLNDLLKDVNGGTRLLREDLRDDEIEIVYKQFANFLLQLFKVDFDRIGNLDCPTREFCFSRPLTWKAHDILQTGGIDTFGDRDQGFSSTTEYFEYIAEQDWKQLLHQPNSTYGRYDAMAKYRSFRVLKSLISTFVHNKYDRTKFKIICDDLGLANLMVRSRQDLTIIGVVDLEWSYIGPAQFLGSAPWWLLMDRPTNQAWDCYEGEPTRIAARYFKYLGIFKRALQEEEAKVLGHGNNELSNLVHWSEHSGAMWAHMLLTAGFNDPNSFPFTKLVQCVGTDEWARRERDINEDEVAAFGAKKALQLEQYNRDLEMIKAHAALVDEGHMKKEEFVALHSSGI